MNHSASANRLDKTESEQYLVLGWIVKIEKKGSPVDLQELLPRKLLKPDS